MASKHGSNEKLLRSARYIGWNEGNTDSQILFITHQAVGIVQSEGQTNNGRDRCKRDIAFVEIQAHSKNFFALVFAFADHT